MSQYKQNIIWCAHQIFEYINNYSSGNIVMSECGKQIISQCQQLQLLADFVEKSSLLEKVDKKEYQFPRQLSSSQSLNHDEDIEQMNNIFIYNLYLQNQSNLQKFNVTQITKTLIITDAKTTKRPRILNKRNKKLTTKFGLRNKNSQLKIKKIYKDRFFGKHTKRKEISSSCEMSELQWLTIKQMQHLQIKETKSAQQSKL